MRFGDSAAASTKAEAPVLQATAIAVIRGGACSGGLGAGSAVQPPTPPAIPRQTVRPTSGYLEVTTADGKVVKLDGEFEGIASATEVITRRIKGHDLVITPKFPAVVNVKQRRN